MIDSQMKKELTNRNGYVIKLFKYLLIFSLFEISDRFLASWISGLIEKKRSKRHLHDSYSYLDGRCPMQRIVHKRIANHKIYSLRFACEIK